MDVQSDILKKWKYKIEFNEEKNLILQETRGISFNEVIKAINNQQILDDFKHKDGNKYPRQKILVIRIKNYIYGVPYILDKKRGAIFLKTVYPSRVLTKKYLKKK